jgi:signal peptidase I
MSKRQKAIAAGVGIIVALLVLAAFGMVRLFQVTGGSMKPEIAPGDYVVMEQFTFFIRKPGRGDIVAFRADRIPPLHDGTIYPKRIVGLAGDHLRLADGKLYLNEKHVAFKNRHGEIPYVSLPGSTYLASSGDSVTVPDGHYFFLGDNSTNSLDSRTCGFLPAKSILGRMWFCYWPPKDVGVLR